MLRRSIVQAAVVAGVLLALSPQVGLGQGEPGANVTIETTVARLARRGDTVEVTYVLRISARSREALAEFTVEAPAAVARISRPEPRSMWHTAVRAYGLSVAHWAMLGARLEPGQESPRLSYEAVGLPAIVVTYAGGWFPTPQDDDAIADSEPNLSPHQLLAANAVVGRTVGVEPFPTDLSPGNLLARLRALTDSACSLAWIQSRETCHELDEHLDQTARELQRGRREEARQHLREFVTDLREHAGRGTGEGDENRGAAVNSSAYWLLTVNAEYLLGRICESGSRC